MNIDLYVNSSQTNVLDKSISMVGSSKILEPFEEINLLSPTILIVYNEEFLKCNYCYIPELNRYFYIENISLEKGQRMTLSLRVDPLMSFKEEILSAQATVLRNEEIGPTNVIDNQLPIDPKELWYEGIDFPQQPLYNIDEELTFNYILVVRN